MSKIGNIISKAIQNQKEEEKKEVKVPTIGDKDGPKPLKTNRLIIQKNDASLEETYYWILNFLRNKNSPFDYEIAKTSDLFTSTESSSFFGNIEHRRGELEQRVSTYMGTIGSLIRSSFQIIREIRIMDERLDYYQKSKGKDKDGKKLSEEEAESSEIALKSIWIDLVEGGAENPGSVLGLSKHVKFVTLPDLFFKLNPGKEKKEVDKAVDSLKSQGINKQVRTILKRKLYQYYNWKEKTKGELDVRRNILLKDLRQINLSVKMYKKWIMPYLRSIKRMQQQGEMDISKNPDLIGGFDTSQISIEILGRKKDYYKKTEYGDVKTDFKKYFPCMRVKLNMVTIPEMTFYKEYQKGAIHVGRITVDFEGYALTKEQWEAYQQKKDDEDLELLQNIDASLEAMDEEYKNYIKEAENMSKKEQEKLVPKPEGFKEIFGGIGTGFKELFSFGGAISKKKDEERPLKPHEIAAEKGVASGMIKPHVYIAYDVYKKAHRMLSW